jgi:hypothetical protein
MKPYCSKCFTQDPEPVESDTGEMIYWFKICEETEEVTTLGLDEEGQVTEAFMGMSVKDFDYDDSFKIICPDCLVEESEQLDLNNELE